MACPTRSDHLIAAINAKDGAADGLWWGLPAGGRGAIADRSGRTEIPAGVHSISVRSPTSQCLRPTTRAFEKHTVKSHLSALVLTVQPQKVDRRIFGEADIVWSQRGPEIAIRRNDSPGRFGGSNASLKTPGRRVFS